MHACAELNILCIGQLMAGKSTFLEGYTHQDPAEQHLKIYLKRERALNCLVYLQEVEQREGVELYLRHGFDGVLFFVKIQDFHNTSRNVLESLSLLSQESGFNVYKIPIKIVVISTKNGQEYDDISYGEKRSFRDEVNNIVTEEQIIYVQSGKSYQNQLTAFYGELLTGTAAGIKETTYSKWVIRGASGLVSFDQLKLQFMQLCEQCREIFITRLKMSPLKWRDRFFYFFP